MERQKSNRQFGEWIGWEEEFQVEGCKLQVREVASLGQTPYVVSYNE
jgi:hypothetical protein